MEQGALTEAVYYILLALHQPLHGYGIMQLVKEMSHERVNLGPGTLYGAINTLISKQWIEPYGTDSRKKEYVITEAGKHAVEIEMKRLQELLQNGIKIREGK